MGYFVNFGLTLPCGLQASRASVTRMAGRRPVSEKKGDEEACDLREDTSLFGF
jgi:hypothetical protein